MNAALAATLMLAPLAAVGAAEPPRALVYAHNPVRTPEPTVEPLPLPVEGRLAHRWLEARSCLDEGRQATVQTAAGPREVSVCTPVATARPDDEGIFSAPPIPGRSGADPFGEASLFHHGGRTLRYFQALGLDPPWPDGEPALLLVANVQLPAALLGRGAAEEGDTGLAPWGDAHFTPAGTGGVFGPMRPRDGDAIWFGEAGEVHLAWDGDVVAHEVAHAVLERFLPAGDFFLDAQGLDGAHGALDEGLADYFAAALTGDAFVGEHAAQGAARWQARDLGAKVTCPQGLSGRRHEDGRIISSALWAVRRQRAPKMAERLDRAVLASVRELSGTGPLPVSRFLQSLLERLEADADTAELAQRARGEWTVRGLLPGCRRVLDLAPAQTITGEAGTFFAPGTEVLEVGGLAPGILQFRVRAPRTARAVRLRFRTGGAGFGPVVLARSGAPLNWSAEGHDAEHVLRPEPGAFRTVEIPLHPAQGPQELYVQIANAASPSGWYDELAVAFELEDNAPSQAEGGANPSLTLLALAVAAGFIAAALRRRHRRARGNGGP